MKVMRGANCWTDHYMVRARLRMMFSLPANVKKRSLPFAVHKLAGQELREGYVQSLEQKLLIVAFPLKARLKNIGTICDLVSLSLLRKLLVEESTQTQSGLRRVLMC